ncbi:MAG: LemA family protein [Natronospirillum sp.]
MKRTLLIFAAAAALAFGFWLVSLGFSTLNQFRQIERLPQMPVAAALPGEVNLVGFARTLSGSDLLTAPDSQTPTLYYRYHVERHVRDSDGNYTWRTVSNRIYWTTFLLEDDSGAIVIDATGLTANVPLSNRVTTGDMRYSEYRIDPGQWLFVLGVAVPRGPSDELTVVFNEPGSYTPLMSAFGEDHERQRLALFSLLLAIAGVATTTLGVYCLMVVLRVHQTIVFLLGQSLVLMVLLVYQGLAMAEADVVDASERLQRAETQGISAVRAVLATQEIFWTGDWQAWPDTQALAALSTSQQQRVNGIRQYVADAQVRTLRLVSEWPERTFVEPDLLMRLQGSASSAAEMTGDFAGTRLTFWYSLLFGSVGLGMLGLGARYGIRRMALKRMIENLPTSPIGGLAYGLSEVIGKAAPLPDEETLVGPLSGRACLAYRYRIDEKRKQGKNTRWVNISVDNRLPVFGLNDANAEQKGNAPLLRVNPRGSDLILRDSDVKYEGKLRYTESRIEPDTTLYVLGPAQVADDTAELEIRTGATDEPFIVSDLTERELMLRKAVQGFALLTVSLVGGVGVALGIAGQSGSFGALPWLLCAAMPLLYLLLALLVLMYNDLVFLRQRARRTWANIEVALKKRSDLIPALESVAKGYLAHEREVQEELAEFRRQMEAPELTPSNATELMQAEQQLHQTLQARWEAYPDLAGDSTMRHLMDSLTRMEDEVAFMRSGYAQAVERYNVRRGQLPEVILARLTGFQPLEPMRAPQT